MTFTQWLIISGGTLAIMGILGWIWTYLERDESQQEVEVKPPSPPYSEEEILLAEYLDKRLAVNALYLKTQKELRSAEIREKMSPWR